MQSVSAVGWCVATILQMIAPAAEISWANLTIAASKLRRSAYDAGCAEC